MDLHLVGGFLGSGKTTAIIGASKYLMAQGTQVGVVTNDQGKYLVDTTFFKLNDIPAVEVTGGCFCCNYDDLEAHLERLKAEIQPEIIFAESVGSCADIVATVVKPLLELQGGLNSPDSFSVFADSRMLLARLQGIALPFSEDVIYIFDKQIEEAGLFVINKIDLLSPSDLQELKDLAANRFPSKKIHYQNAFNNEDLIHWMTLVAKGDAAMPETPLEIDYERYGSGEALLAWLDEEIILQVPEGTGRTVVLYLLEAITTELREKAYGIGHMKIILRAGDHEAKISFPALEEPGWREKIPPLAGVQIRLLINARVETNAQTLRQLMQDALERTASATGTSYGESRVDFFHPGFPKPTHRLT
jgi:Ni2+-binding GTPase involved in maturation of urease and hydrogenase